MATLRFLPPNLAQSCGEGPRRPSRHPYTLPNHAPWRRGRSGSGKKHGFSMVFCRLDERRTWHKHAARVRDGSPDPAKLGPIMQRGGQWTLRREGQRRQGGQAQKDTICYHEFYVVKVTKMKEICKKTRQKGGGGMKNLQEATFP